MNPGGGRCGSCCLVHKRTQLSTVRPQTRPHPRHACRPARMPVLHTIHRTDDHDEISLSQEIPTPSTAGEAPTRLATSPPRQWHGSTSDSRSRCRLPYRHPRHRPEHHRGDEGGDPPRADDDELCTGRAQLSLVEPQRATRVGACRRPGSPGRAKNHAGGATVGAAREGAGAL